MAKKRMFRLDVLETDAFMELPLSTQALYFHLGLRADDDGFVGNPKMITRNVGASQDDLKLLIAKKFLICFEDGVIVIKHWRMHNTLSANRYTETKYKKDKALLLLKGNKAYSLNSGIPLDDSHQIESGQRQTNNRQTIDEQKTNTDIDKEIEKDIDIIPPCIPPLQGEESPTGITQKKKRNSKPFKAPTLDEVREYISSANLNVDPKAFYDYFTTPDDDGKTWIDSEGKPVRNWKQKIQTWARMGTSPTRVRSRNTLLNYNEHIEDRSGMSVTANDLDLEELG